MSSTEYKGFYIDLASDGEVYLCQIVSPAGDDWCKFLSGSIPDAMNRAFELIDSEAGRDIIAGMEVTKPRTLQVGDIVTIRTTAHKSASIGIIESIQENQYYWVCELKYVNGFYQKASTEACYQLEKLALYPNREKWMQIKRDLDRQKDGTILQNWIDSL